MTGRLIAYSILYGLLFLVTTKADPGKEIIRLTYLFLIIFFGCLEIYTCHIFMEFGFFGKAIVISQILAQLIIMNFFRNDLRFQNRALAILIFLFCL